MATILDLGSFDPPENLDEDIIESNCVYCDIDFDEENERCIDCVNNLANEIK